jgi:hypothetical protein
MEVLVFSPMSATHRPCPLCHTDNASAPPFPLQLRSVDAQGLLLWYALP